MTPPNRHPVILVTVTALAALLALYLLTSSNRTDLGQPEGFRHAAATSATQPASPVGPRPTDVEQRQALPATLASVTPTSAPAAQIVPTTRMNRTDADYRFLAAGMRFTGGKLSEELRLSAARAAELRATIEPYRVRAEAVQAELNNRLFQTSRAIVANGGGELYSADDPNTKRSVAKRIAPHNADQNVVYVSHNGGNYVVRFNPGQDPQVDSFNAALRTEYIECAHVIRRRFPDLFPPQ